ncbi:MAG: hypothetical protein KDC42_01575 [Ignavibacteriae bacterium]|nr:hypothetical protein [Ignavibacteriota bacterium]
MAKYTEKIVVFLDILGFSNMLNVFEKEALGNDDSGIDLYHQSPKLNSILKVIDDSIQLLNKNQCKCYLFSDNICFTIDFVDDETEFPDLFIEVLLLINILFKDFLKNGYLLRGGIDVGWFLEDDSKAIGVPLLNAYYLESKIAIYPRVLLSEKFIEYLKQYAASNVIKDSLINKKDLLIYNQQNRYYLNSFAYIFEIEDKNEKIDYFITISNMVSELYSKQSYKGKRLIECRKVLHVKKKYKWFINEYNKFINLYISNYNDFEVNEINYNPSELNLIKNLTLKK